MRARTASVLLAAMAIGLASDVRATNNIISDQLVDGAGNPYQKPSGGDVTLDDLGLGRVPQGNNSAIKIVPWSTIPGGISQMAHIGDRLFFGTTAGQIFEYDQQGDRDSTPLLNIPAIRAPFSTGGPFSGQGMRGFAFHPGFDNNGLLYTLHREVGGGTATHGDMAQNQQYVLGEWDYNDLVGGDPAFRSLLRVGYTATDHAGGQIGFNPVAVPGDVDYGLLYAGFGDGGGGCSGSNACINQYGYGQNMSTIQSSIIRLNPLESGGAPYTIPADNPFLAASDPTNAIPDEMFAKGFRNASTMMFDQQTGALYSGDISQNTIEEINLIESGHNYGWGIHEGTMLFTDLTDPGDSVRYIPLGDGSDVSATDATFAGFDTQGNPVEFNNINRLNDGYTSPLAMFTHEANDATSAAVTGSVYYGSAAPALQGKFLFGNLSQDELYYIQQSEINNDETPATVYELVNLHDEHGNPIASFSEIVGSDRTNIRFGQDGNGELYIISKHNNVIYRFLGLGLPGALGDVNLDTVINQQDVAALLAGWRQSAPIGQGSWRLGDLDQNGVTDIRDAVIMHDALLAATGAGLDFSIFTDPVPEPSSAAIATVAGLLVAQFYRRGLSTRSRFA